MGKESGTGRMNRVVSAAAVRSNARNWNAVTPAAVLAGEQGIRNNRGFETGIVYDVNGNFVASRKGEAHSVSLDGINIANRIVTHNHPSGGSFSPADISSAMKGNVAEIRVVTNRRTFSIKRPAKGWGGEKEISRALGMYDYASRYLVRSDLKAYVGRGESMGDREFGIRVHRAQMSHSHLVVKQVAKAMGWEYSYVTEF